MYVSDGPHGVVAVAVVIAEAAATGWVVVASVVTAVTRLTSGTHPIGHWVGDVVGVLLEDIPRRSSARASLILQKPENRRRRSRGAGREEAIGFT